MPIAIPVRPRQIPCKEDLSMGVDTRAAGDVAWKERVRRLVSDGRERYPLPLEATAGTFEEAVAELARRGREDIAHGRYITLQSGDEISQIVSFLSDEAGREVSERRHSRRGWCNFPHGQPGRHRRLVRPKSSGVV